MVRLIRAIELNESSQEGTKRSIQLPDDSVFVTKPTCVVQLQLRGETADFDADSILDEKELIDRMKAAETKSLQVRVRLLLINDFL